MNDLLRMHQKVTALVKSACASIYPITSFDYLSPDDTYARAKQIFRARLNLR